MISPSTITDAVPVALIVDGNGTDDLPAAPITDGTGDLTSRIDDLPAAPIADDTGGNGTDSLIELLAQMNITGQEASDVTSKIHDAVQNALVAAVSAISAVKTTSASAPLIPALTPVVTYNVPAADATGPFYWVTRGRCIGIFSTWQQTSSHVIGVSRASFSKVRSVAEGIQLMEEAIDRGETEVLT
ncbi:uncharacterized protein F5891DRAFT_977548 [Suillus fuscotomentosus]|uniref:Ribonuclease H1 N-terminal domain-containing protein n=1 Tax=Suillus fuscotomentosus TaxID=1912939 RepID=A0AAD4ED34_9AGAM|nr:uncharacterized protein F5891DRAFT_977548 [Suillus fuscotomentosus]KAG1904045.1 hypothetical protein F5891DRAFT_977548 [Suillus fuscotomentosus]